MNIYDSSSAVAKDLGIQYGVWSLVRTLASFFDFFIHHFYPMVTVLLEYPDPATYSCLVFAL